MKEKNQGEAEENGTAIFVRLQIGQPVAVTAAPGLKKRGALVIGQNE